MSKKDLYIFFFVMIVVTLFAVWKADFLEDHGSVVQAWVTVVLVILTAVYVRRTGQQADASMKMAEEMKAQRYDTVRPVIDIEVLSKKKQPASEALTTTKDRDISYIVDFVLHNIGLGPAVGVCSVSIIPTTDQRWLWDFDTIAAGKTTKTMHLLLTPEDGLLTLTVFYRDAYDRHFESGRQINIDEEKRAWEIGPLLLSQNEELPK